MRDRDALIVQFKRNHRDERYLYCSRAGTERRVGEMFDSLQRLLSAIFSAERNVLKTGCLGWVGGIFSAILLAILSYEMPEIAGTLRTPERVLSIKADAQAAEVIAVTGELSNTTSGFTKKLIDTGDGERNLALAIASKIMAGDSIDVRGASDYQTAVSTYMGTIKATEDKANEVDAKYHLNGRLNEGLRKYFQVLANSSQNTADCLADIQKTYKPDEDAKYTDVRCAIAYGADKRRRFYKLTDRVKLLDQCSFTLRNYIDMTVHTLQESSQSIAAEAKNRADKVKLLSFDSITRRFGVKDGVPDKPTANRRDRTELLNICIKSDLATTYANNDEALAGTYPPPESTAMAPEAPKTPTEPSAPKPLPQNEPVVPTGVVAAKTR